MLQNSRKQYLELPEKRLYQYDVKKNAGEPKKQWVKMYQRDHIVSFINHWHTDFTYLKIGGAFYFLVCVLDGASRAILSWHLKPRMKEAVAPIAIPKAREAYPDQKPRIISDNGSQYTSQDHLPL